MSSKDKIGEKQQFVQLMLHQKENWKQTLATVPPAEHNAYLLSMPAKERMEILKMQMVLQMQAAEEAKQTEAGTNLKSSVSTEDK